jgi:hypothetical protein
VPLFNATFYFAVQALCWFNGGASGIRKVVLSFVFGEERQNEKRKKQEEKLGYLF